MKQVALNHVIDKHVYAVRFWIATNIYLHEKLKPKVFASDAIPYDKCSSIRIIKLVGFDCSKRTYYCKYCQHKFRQPSLLKGVKFSSELITLTRFIIREISVAMSFEGKDLMNIILKHNRHTLKTFFQT